MKTLSRILTIMALGVLIAGAHCEGAPVPQQVATTAP